MADILITDAASWQRAIARGAARTDALRGLAISGEMVTAMVESESGGLYHVTVAADGDGQHAACTCPAGQHGRACWHVGAVLGRIAERHGLQPRIDLRPGTCRRCGGPLLPNERGTLCGRCALAVLNGDD